MTKEEIIQRLYKGDSRAIKEAIKALEQQSENCVVEDLLKEVSEQERWLSDAGYNVYNVDIAFKSIVKAIENVHITTSEDCVSRQAVIDYIKTSEADLWHEPENEGVIEDIQSLPPVTPTHGTCKDCRWLTTDEEDTYYCIQTGCFDSFDFYCADFEKRGSENE